MIYCVGPDSNQARDLTDLLDTVKETGTYMFRSVSLYNSRPDVCVPIVFVRVCLVSADCEPHFHITQSAFCAPVKRKKRVTDRAPCTRGSVCLCNCIDDSFSRHMTLIPGVSAELNETKTDCRPDNQCNVTFQFAYDEDVVKIAYDHLTKAFGRV
jgi:hypothetical protein